jgi:ABC-2 type transport system ATP-binding protein
MLTTHYMDEAERLCDRVAIVDHGQVIALGTPGELISRLGGEHVIDFSLLEGFEPLKEAQLAELPTARSARRTEVAYSVSVEQPHIALPALLALLETSQRPLAHLTTRHATLEDVFVSLTGRNLAEENNA